MRELCALVACSRSEYSKPVANASRPLTPLSMNLCDSFGVEELVTAPVSNAPLDHSHFHPTCKLQPSISFEYRLPPLRTSASSNFSRNSSHHSFILFRTEEEEEEEENGRTNRLKYSRKFFLVIVYNFRVEVTVDKYYNSVREWRVFARRVRISFYGIPRGKHKLKKDRTIAAIVATRSTFFSFILRS